MIRIDLSKCTGCRRCELACSFFHSGRINRHLSRIKVLNLYEQGIDAPVACVQCQERYCLQCPEKALSLGPQGQIIVAPTVCTLCGVCEKNCPVGAIEIFEGIVYVCDLCGGNPKCVEACTEGALIHDPGKELPSLDTYRKKNRHKNPSEKRYAYLKDQTNQVRKQWRKRDA